MPAAYVRALAALIASAACSSMPPGAPPVTHGPPVFAEELAFQGVTYPYLVAPPDAGPTPPVLLVVHGSGGRGADMLDLWLDLAGRQGILLVAPTLPLDPSHPRFEELVPALYPAILEAVRRRWPFDPRRVYVFGYSAGGYTAFDAATLDSTQFAAAGVFAAAITAGYEHIVTEAVRKTPIAYFIGDRDQYWSLAQTRATRDLLLQNGFPVHYVELANQDHGYAAASAQVNADAWSYLREFTLP